MHEMSLINDLLQKIDRLAAENSFSKISGVSIELGALSHISADHFKEHFVEGTKGHIAHGAELKVTELKDIDDPFAQEIRLTDITGE